MRALATITCLAVLGIGASQDLDHVGSRCWEHRYLIDLHSESTGQNVVYTVPAGKTLVLTDLLIMASGFNKQMQIRSGIDGPVLYTARTRDRSASHFSWKSPVVLNSGEDLVLQIGTNNSGRMSVLGFLIPERESDLPAKCSIHLQTVRFQGNTDKLLYRVPPDRVLVVTDIHLEQSGTVPVHALRENDPNGPIRLHLAHSEAGNLRTSFSSGIRFAAGSAVFFDYISGDRGGTLDCRGYLVPIEKR